MSTTSSPTRPAPSFTPVLNDEDTELQAFLAAAKRKVQEKWEKLRVAKMSGVEEKVGEDGGNTVEAKGNAKEDVVEVEKEVVPKIEAKPRKVVMRMVAGLPRNREVIPKRRNVADLEVAESSRKKQKVVRSPVVVDTDSDSIPVPFPRPCERCVRGDQVPHREAELFFPSESEENAGSIPTK
ncbi:hypothetical protein GGU10DRAFT_380759 [Lentinula aff. detonsa]|uniref:Uncharacterized protein n=1 Tax=Lentinula aff. detonsa TaxID=2804958 RepID=A0AA38L1R1_9AGAR|nr:hypothetical protein GGU10DRAFT_380759 [Lentinula aff. detonsa]